MKRVILLSTLVLAAAITSYGQGTVVFANPGQNVKDSRNPSASGVNKSQFKVALYWLPDQVAEPTTADFDAAGPSAIAVTDPFLADGIFAHTGSVRIEGITPAGGIAWMQVRAWETAFGTDYATASTVLGAMVGTSTPFRIDTGNPLTVPAGTAAGIVGAGFKSFMVYPVVPEPTAIGLGLLGFGSLLLLRRRK